MAQMRRTVALAVLVLGTAAAALAQDDAGQDLAPLVPVAQKRIQDANRYYGGPQGNAFFLAPDGKHAVTSMGGNGLLVYDLSKSQPRGGRQLQTENLNFYNPALAFMPDGKTLVGMSSNYPDFNIHFWDIESGKETRQIDNDMQFGGLAVSPDGKQLALGTNQHVEIWDLATTDEVRNFPGVANQNQFFRHLAF
jgi:WD40 repeat protein